MAKLHNLGFARIGANRELKFALEDYWGGRSTADELLNTARTLRLQNFRAQEGLDLVPVGDASLYDHVLDMSVTLGNLPKRAQRLSLSELDRYFCAARGRSAQLITLTESTESDAQACCPIHDHPRPEAQEFSGLVSDQTEAQQIPAAQMTKWFDTNYHYLVPEFSKECHFSLNAERLLTQLAEAQATGAKAKPVILGPVSYLRLGKAKDGSNPLDLLPRLLTVYAELLSELHAAGAEWVQIDEPVLVTELEPEWRQAYERAYHALQGTGVKLLLTTYFGELAENLTLALELPVAGLHIDATHSRREITAAIDWLPANKVLSLGVISGREVWKADLTYLLDWLEPIAEKLGDRLWLAPSCSLLHVPVDLAAENANGDADQQGARFIPNLKPRSGIDPEVLRWLSFGRQKIEELSLIGRALNQGRSSVEAELRANQQDCDTRRTSKKVHNLEVKARAAKITLKHTQRTSPYALRSKIQQGRLNLPLYPTTTIGSFPQTAQIRKARLDHKKGRIGFSEYEQLMQEQISHAVSFQHDLGLDVLVHGEAERNDMVEYFGEQLSGFVISQFGWVQSYGSRCVKPPILFGDVSRPAAMTVAWSQFAQSLTDKPMKGMLTGPVTILNWSFVRDDQTRAESCAQIALAIRDEVLDLEAAGLPIIQIDEAALREGLPLKRREWQVYLDWAIRCFRIAASGAADNTQIHTHMCYSEFGDIMESIARMDADVITIETARSDMQLLDVFERFDYPSAIGPGVYDIHSPNEPSPDHMVALMQKAAKRIDPVRLWVNPDCGLKTRQWPEVLVALKHMVAAAQTLREQAASLKELTA